MQRVWIFKVRIRGSTKRVKLIYPIMKNKRLTFIVLALIFFAGCGPVDQETVNEVLTKDPSFANILKEKSRNNEKILSLQAEFNKEKDKILNDIITKRDNLRTKEDSFKTEVLSIRKKMEPELQKLKSGLEKAKVEYEEIKGQLNNSIDKLKNIKKLLNKKGELSLSGDEVSVWNNRIKELDVKIASYGKDLDKLKSKMRLIRTEIKIIQK